MPTGKSPIPTDEKSTTGAVGVVTGEICKALKAASFYPEKHPLRTEVITRAHGLLLEAVNNRDLTLVITRTGISSVDGRPQAENSLAAKTLARELFTREIQRLSFLPDLSLKDFEMFLSLLMTEPQKITAGGGMEKILSELGIRSIITNEIDISTVFTKKNVSGEESPEAPPAMTEHCETVSLDDFLPLEQMGEMEVEEIIEAMEKEEDDGVYCGLAGLLAVKARPLSARRLFGELTPILLFLAKQSTDAAKSPAKRAAALGASGELADRTVIEHLLEQMKDRNFRSRETVYLILTQIGEIAVEPVILCLINAGDIHSRKAIATALVRIGIPAVPLLASYLKDPKWYVVRSMLAILGEIGCGDCIRELGPVTIHEDARVRKEAIRCLTKIGGPEAVSMLLEFLADKDQSIVKQAIFSLGILKNEKAVDPLMEIVGKWDVFLKTLPLKKEAVRALGVIGSRKSLPFLMSLATKRRLFAATRWQELKISAIEAIALTEGESAFDFLLSMSSQDGPVGKTCRNAINSINGKAT